MHGNDRTAEEKIDLLHRRLESLSRRVAALESRLGVDAPPVPERPAPAGPPARESAGAPESISDEMIRWAGKASLFPRLATLCFLLVIALILRTVTDNGLVNALLGMALGMGYAAVLVLAGWFLYRRHSSLAPVFAACGAILLSSIVVETHARFRSLPLVPAYWTLMATGAGMAFISRQFTVFLPVSVGTLGMCLAGAAIDYPEPFFPYLFMILVTANLLGYYAGTLKRCSWLRWIVLLVTLTMILLWGMRLGAAFSRHETPAPALAPAWFLPVLATVALIYAGIAVMGIVRSGRERLFAFDFSLPAINAAGAYLAARSVVSTDDGSALALSVVAILFALLHGGAAFWLASRRIDGAPGTTAFAFAAIALLVLALPDAFGGLPIALPLLAVTALALAPVSGLWESGGIRATSYLLQAYCATALGVFILSHGPEAAPPAGTAAAGALAAAALIHYRWCRRHAPPAASVLFTGYDPRDRSGVVPLLGALAGAFFLLRGIAHRFLPMIPGDATQVFHGIQSIIINLSALGLGLYAFRARNREIRNVAILVTAVGAVMSTADLLGIKGVPLVLSVFSFGLAAASQSIFLSRWQRMSVKEAGMTAVERTGGA